MPCFDDIKPGTRLKGLDGFAVAEVVSVSRFRADALNLVFRVDVRVRDRFAYRGEVRESHGAHAMIPRRKRGRARIM